MAVTRIKVVSKISSNASFSEREREGRRLIATFKKLVDQSGIITEYKRRQTFESKSEKKRRKMREADLQREKETDKLRTRLRDHFGS